MPVYYVVGTQGGARLYREFQSVPTGDPGTAAVRTLLASDSGVDPDYRSSWPPGWSLRFPVEHAGGVVTVDLDPPGDAGAANRGPATAEAAGLAVQQLVYTVQGALGSTDPVQILLGGRPAERLWGQVPISAPIARANPSATRSLVQIDNPVHGAALGRTVRVSGEAAVFEANVLWQVLQGQAVVQHGFATATEAYKFSPYSFTVTLAPGDYTLRVYEADESDGEGRPPFSDTKAITVR